MTEERKIFANLFDESKREDLKKKQYMKHLIQMYHSLRDQNNIYYFVMKLYSVSLSFINLNSIQSFRYKAFENYLQSTEK